jgi:hypothetical protein
LAQWEGFSPLRQALTVFCNVSKYLTECFTLIVQGGWSKKCKEALNNFELLKEGKSKYDIVYEKAVQVALLCWYTKLNFFPYVYLTSSILIDITWYKG